MLLFGKPIEEVIEDDLRALIENEIVETKTLEYKMELPGESREAKMEFLNDVSSFANASGGDIIFGIKEEKGIPKEIISFPKEDFDREKLRLENMLRDGIRPRIFGINFHSIDIKDNKVMFSFEFTLEQWEHFRSKIVYKRVKK